MSPTPDTPCQSPSSEGSVKNQIEQLGQLALDWTALLDSGSCCTVQQLEELSERGKDKNMDMGFCSPDFENGMSPLHRASRSGNKVAVEWLLCKGHAWNLVDNDGRTCGEMAMENGHDEIYEMLVQEGIRAELILSLLSTANAANEKGGEDDDDQKEEDDKGAQTASNQEYLDSKLEFKDGLLVDQKTDAVMMGWESKFMHDHAIAICPQPGRDVLNVGFGLGIIDSILQDLKPRRHVIIEAHPDVYAKMLADGWDKKPGVEIFFGRWQDQIHNVGCFDGIFFDTFGEFYQDLKEFHENVPNLLKDEGIYSFFNGLAGTNPFFHDVYCRIAEMDLQEMGIATEYVEIAVPKEIDDNGVWDNIRRRYFSLDTYRLPICKFK